MDILSELNQKLDNPITLASYNGGNLSDNLNIQVQFKVGLGAYTVTVSAQSFVGTWTSETTDKSELDSWLTAIDTHGRKADHSDLITYLGVEPRS